MARYKFTETDTQKSKRICKPIIKRALKGCNVALIELREYATSVGGKIELASLLGVEAAGIQSDYTALQILVNDLRDVAASDLG